MEVRVGLWNHCRYSLIRNTDTFIIIYMIMVYPLIPTSISAIAILLMAVPVAFKLFICAGFGRSVAFNNKIMPLMVIPILAAFSGGITAIAYAGKIGVTLLTVSMLKRNTERNYSTFLKVVRLNGIFVVVTMLFEYFFRNIAITLYRPIWNLYLHGSTESLMLSIMNARKGMCYGIIPSASYAVNALTFAMGTYLIRIEKRRNKVLLLLMYIGIFMTSKRSYMVFVTITTLAIRYLMAEKRNRFNRLIEALLLAFLVIVAWIVIEPYIKYSPTGLGKLLATIKYFNNPVYIKQYFIRAERDVLGKYAIKLFKENWAFGVGWGNFSKLYLQDTGIWRLDAHTTYLQILCESGIFAAAIIFALLFREMFRSIRLIKKDRKLYYYVTYVIVFCMLISFTSFIFDLTQFYVTLFMCIYFMRNISPPISYMGERVRGVEKSYKTRSADAVII